MQMGQRTAEGNRLTTRVALMKVKTCRPVAHTSALRTQLMKTETRQIVDHVGVEKAGQDSPTKGHRQDQAGEVEAQVALTPVWNAQQIAHQENAYTKQGMKILLGKSIYAKGVLTLRRTRQDSLSVLL